MASISIVREIQKMSRIYRAVRYCILLSFLRENNNGVVKGENYTRQLEKHIFIFYKVDIFDIVKDSM